MKEGTPGNGATGRELDMKDKWLARGLVPSVEQFSVALGMGQGFCSAFEVKKYIIEKGLCVLGDA